VELEIIQFSCLCPLDGLPRFLELLQRKLAVSEVSVRAGCIRIIVSLMLWR
jgi:hypothetical protein